MIRSSSVRPEILEGLNGGFFVTCYLAFHLIAKALVQPASKLFQY
jgi:hypothetical protein